MSGFSYSEWQYDPPLSLPEGGMASCIIVSESDVSARLSFSRSFLALGSFDFPLFAVCVLQEQELP